MQAMISVDPRYVVAETLFDRADLIEIRVLDAPVEVRKALGKSLRYLFRSDGPTNLSRDDLASIPYLTSLEQKVLRWLFIRTNGGL